MKRETRYQGAIIRNHHILLIKHCEHATGRTYWLLPGGGREHGETEEACVQREMHEETHLDVSVERLLLNEDDIPFETYYNRLKTYLCRAAGGDAQPGYDPEAESAQQHAITEARWFDLRNPALWGDCIADDPLIFPLLHRIRAVLGYG
ncbi:MAG: NUDIX domain-containing protein [Dehalococcoidia bacterium]|nr:NUDIX domain-containing protein [Dehalococcoidia bacterium]